MKYIFILAGCLVFSRAASQTKLAEMPLLANRVWDLQTFQVSDRLLATCLEQGANGQKNKVAIWVAADGQTEKARFDDLRDATLICVYEKENIIRYYALNEKDKKLVLEEFVEDRNLRKRNKTEQSVPIEGYFVASFANQGKANILCYNPEKEILTCYALDGIQAIERHDIASIKRKHLNKEGFEFFGGAFTNANLGNLGIKAVHEADFLNISLDHLFEDKTKVIRVDLADYKVDSSYINHSPAKHSSSVISNEHLYRLTGDVYSLYVEVFRLSDGKRVALQPFALNQIPERVSYSREGDKSEISKERIFRTTGALGVVDYAMVIESGETRNFIRLGSHVGDRPSFIPGPYGLSIYLGSSLGNAMRTNDDSPGINRYFYISESKDHSNFQVISNASDFPSCQRADENEIVLEKAYRVNTKAYMRMPSFLVGIYTANKKLIFTKY